MLVSETMWFFGPFPTHPKPLVAAPAPLAAILFTPHRAAGGISALTLHRTAFFVHRTPFAHLADAVGCKSGDHSLPFLNHLHLARHLYAPNYD